MILTALFGTMLLLPGCSFGIWGVNRILQHDNHPSEISASLMTTVIGGFFTGIGIATLTIQ